MTKVQYCSFYCKIDFFFFLSPHQKQVWDVWALLRFFNEQNKTGTKQNCNRTGTKTDPKSPDDSFYFSYCTPNVSKRARITFIVGSCNLVSVWYSSDLVGKKQNKKTIIIIIIIIRLFLGCIQAVFSTSPAPAQCPAWQWPESESNPSPPAGTTGQQISGGLNTESSSSSQTVCNVHQMEKWTKVASTQWSLESGRISFLSHQEHQTRQEVLSGVHRGCGLTFSM